MRETDEFEKIKPSLILLKPRQVLLNMKQGSYPTVVGNGSAEKNVTLETSIGNSNHKALLEKSICQYLERNGFAKTLKSFQSEAQVQSNMWKSCTLDVEEIFNKYLDMGANGASNMNSNDGQDLQTYGNTKKDGDRNLVTSMEAGMKKKKKRRDGCDNITNVCGEILSNEAQSTLQTKQPKNNKMPDENIEKVGSESLKDSADDTLQVDKSNTKHKDKKKKKSKLILESSDAYPKQLETLPVVSKEKSKDKKKKKNKSPADSLVENIEQCLEDSQVSKTKKIDSTPLDENIKIIDKKRKKDAATSEDENTRALEENAIYKEKKSSKKRKRLTSEETGSQPVDNMENEGPKRKKVEGEEIDNGGMQLTMADASLGNAGDSAEETNGQNNQFVSDEAQKTSTEQHDTHVNVKLPKSGGDKSLQQRDEKKQHNGSAEPKTVNAFQRVKIDQVVFADDRLQNNSYWAKDGAEIGYGAKAQEILGQVKGRDFRHEKTKKKRGSYRGGQIDVQSHSVKFNYSDDE